MRFKRWSAALPALLAMPLVIGCETPAAPFLVEGAERFDPPPAYQLWWDLTQQCSARRGSFAGVRWYVVPGASTLLVNGQRVEGYWTSGNAIVLAEAATFSGPLVRHEMLHALQEGDGHPREFFLSRCGGVVVCGGPCASDAEPLPAPDPETPRVTPDALEIDVEIRPQVPSHTLYGGFFTMVVTARNPRSDAVVVTLPTTTFGEPGVSFAWEAESGGVIDGGHVRAMDEAVTRFAPGETKRQVFDFKFYNAIGRANGLAPGTYTLRGADGGGLGARVGEGNRPLSRART